MVAVVFGECHAGPEFAWRRMSGTGESKNVLAHRGETSGFTKCIHRSGTGKPCLVGLACGGHPPQATAVFTAPPQTGCEYQLLSFDYS